MLYSYKQKYPEKIPERIRLSSGLTRTDSSTFTEEEITDAGFVKVGDMPLPSSDDKKIDWDGVSWYERDFKEDEIHQRWIRIRRERDTLLQNSDIQILKYLELNEPVPEPLQAYRQALRDIPQNNTSPFNIVWPTYE